MVRRRRAAPELGRRDGPRAASPQARPRVALRAPAAEERERVREYVVGLAERDPRVVAGAAVGSLALGGGDEWSDLDLAFAVADGTSIPEVLDEWTRELADEFGAVQLLDLPVGEMVYRVFLLGGWMQLDVSFAPGRVRRTSERFQLLFGEHEDETLPRPSAENVFGWAVVFARHGHVCIERGHLWQAEFCVAEVRGRALTLACLRRDLPTGYAKGYDRLPADVREPLQGALVASLQPEELRRGLGVAVTGLLREAADLGEMFDRVEARLRELSSTAA